jgi:hypothetical protein
MDWARVQPWITRTYNSTLPAVSEWWNRQSRYAQLGYMAAGGYLSMVIISRMLRTLTHRRGLLTPYPPPRQIQDIYGRIDRSKSEYARNNSEFGSPVDLGSVIDRGASRMDGNFTSLNLQPTAGLVQQAHRSRMGHTSYGMGRARGHLRRLYQIG